MSRWPRASRQATASRIDFVLAEDEDLRPRSAPSVRPGHHAESGKAMGFCFFNNVAVAARHALEAWNLSRVAIIDFDVHHGNGTEQIFAGDSRVLMASIFQHPFYPYCGTENPAPNMCNVPLPAGTRAATSSAWW
jgi:acetoin utilization deacetylase AcuC-like enzyme